MDTQINEDILHGYTFSYINDDVDVGTSGTSLDIDTYSISKYVTFHQGEDKFVEGNIGFGSYKDSNISCSSVYGVTHLPVWNSRHGLKS